MSRATNDLQVLRRMILFLSYILKCHSSVINDLVFSSSCDIGSQLHSPNATPTIWPKNLHNLKNNLSYISIFLLSSETSWSSLHRTPPRRIKAVGPAYWGQRLCFFLFFAFSLYFIYFCLFYIFVVYMIFFKRLNIFIFYFLNSSLKSTWVNVLNFRNLPLGT